MKTISIAFAFAWLGVNSLLAQDQTNSIELPLILERGPHHQVVATMHNLTNELGEVTTQTNSYTELATGLNFQKDGQWTLSKAEIEILPAGGAAATNGQHQAYFPADIGGGIIQLVTPDGKNLRSQILGVGYYDPSSGQAVLLGEVKSCIGMLYPPNVVVYEDAFDGLLADVRYTYTQAGFEQDIILRESPAPPEDYGLNPQTTRVEVLTEFIQPPKPVEEVTTEAGIVDEALSFGVMKIGRGIAFSLDEPTPQVENVRVFKSWEKLEGRDFLIEHVGFKKIEAALDVLPPSPEGASFNPPGKDSKIGRLASNRVIPKSRMATAQPSKKMMQMAKLTSDSRKGFVIDYFTLNSQANYTFGADTNYYVGGLVNLTGTTTIEGGTVVKFTNSTAAKINITGTIDCKTGPYRPAVFTSKNDNTVGETLPGSTGNPTNYYGNGLVINTTGNSLHDLRIAYAASAVTLGFTAGQINLTNVQFIKCQYPIDSSGKDENTIVIDNGLFYSSGYVIKGGEDLVVSGSHLTVNQCDRFGYTGFGSTTGHLKLTNSIVVAATNGWGQFGGISGSVTTNNTAFFTSDPGGVFQSVGGASHYLADNSPYRNVGTTSINAALAEVLKSRTTYPPILLTNNFTSATVLSSQAPRDADLPDLGYHYDPIDYVVSGRTVSANLTLTGGVTLGTYGAASTFGLRLNSGSFVSEGSPTRLNWIVRYNTVQEQSTTNWSATSVAGGVRRESSSANVSTRFTGWSMLGNIGDHFNDATDASNPAAFSHSRFCGGKFTVDTGSIALTNCLWERVYVTVKSDNDNVPWYVFNNLFFGGTFYYRGRGDSDLTLAFDNVFDKTVITRGTGGTSDYFTHGNNGYVGGVTHLQGTSSGGDINITWPAGYQDGPLGKYYYNTSGNLNVLINADNTRNPANVGLYHYTVKKAADTKEGTDSPANLDIGFHYAAVDANGNPLDGDNDGLADYLEDTNGNGSYGAGDLANLGASDTDGDGMFDGWEWHNFGTFSRDGSEDYDDDGMIDSVEAQHGADPNTIQFYTLFDSLRVNGNSLTGTVTLLAGVPAKIAVQSTTNFASASWRTYNANFIASIGTSDGAYPVYVGLKGMADTSEVTWAGYHVTRDTTAPLMVITNPLAGVVFQPMLQLQGYSPEPLASVRYDLSNTNGSLTNMEGYVVKQFVDTNTFEITTNWFACVDLNLAAGTNTVTLKATDRAGNVTTTNLNYVFVYPTNAPVLSLVWPQDGDLLSGTSFTVRGRLSDPTAKVTAEVVGDGETHSMTGIVERDGKFWIENVPLAAGANEVTISVVDAGTNSSGTNFTVVKSGVELTIDPLNSSELNNPFITVYGSINVSTHKIWVNGMEVTNVSSGTWYVVGVPLNEDGTAVVQARAIALTDNGGNGTGGSGGGGGGGGSGSAGQSASFDNPGNPDSPTDITTEADADKQAEVVMIHYEKNRSYLSLTRDEYPVKKQTKEIIKWDVKQPGSWFNDDCDGNTFGSHMYYVCNSRNWEGNGIGTLKSWEDRGGEEVCGVQLYGAPTPYTLEAAWQGEYCGTTGYRVIAGEGIAMDQVVARTARTLYELHTGGKQLSGRKNLFVLSGGVEGVGNAFWPEDADDKQSYEISNTSVLLGDIGYLDSDGKIYPVLPDGQTRDVTPRVDGNPYYTFGEPGHSKHGLELVLPYSKPTDGPIAGNKIYYSYARPGVLTLLFEAVLTNNGPAWAVTNRVRFEADEIAGSTPSWSPDHPGGQPTASGSSLFATLYYTNLPPSNSAFGLKFGRVRLDGEVQDEKCFWVFYLADAYNWPGCRDWINPDPQYHEPEYDPTRPPNYFYYYMQTAAAVHAPDCDSPTYDWRGSGTRFGLQYNPPLDPPFPFVLESARHREGQTIKSPGANAGQVLAYIDLFAWASRHEQSHHANYHDWWTTGTPPRSYNSATDSDGDYLPDTLEPEMSGSVGGPYNPQTKHTYGTEADLDDTERCVSMTAVQWLVGDADKADWAKPGKQWNP